MRCPRRLNGFAAAVVVAAQFGIAEGCGFHKVWRFAAAAPLATAATTGSPSDANVPAPVPRCSDALLLEWKQSSDSAFPSPTCSIVIPSASPLLSSPPCRTVPPRQRSPLAAAPPNHRPIGSGSGSGDGVGVAEGEEEDGVGEAAALETPTFEWESAHNHEINQLAVPLQ